MSRFARLSRFTLLFIGLLSFSVSAQSPAPKLRLHGSPSSRDLLRRSFAPEQVRSGADTLRILALRVEFQTDTTLETTGNGRFILSASDSALIDPPPHDRTYFEAQLAAVASYFATVSNGRLVLQGEVYPRQATAAYQLPQQMQYYAPGADAANADQRLAELFRDALTAADQTDQLDFSLFQSFWVFHAGVGRDLSLDFDATPNDVPSAFLSLNDLRTSLGQGDAAYQGIVLQGGAFRVQDGIILPETQSQEGFEIGLLGTAAIMFGFQLGLPALFNPENGVTGIGRWGLMDQGSGNFQGLLPAEPNAWEKVYLGWERPILIDAWREFTVAAPREEISPNKIYKLPITADEYYLIENRQRDINGDNIAIGHDANGKRVEFRFSENGFAQVVADTIIDVVTSVDREYDYGLPGSGILIWHIDDSVIRANLATNHVNADRARRGVRLVEADGAQDIGQFYGFLHPGSGAENGVQEDAWFRDNPINKLVNKSEVVVFGPHTLPATRSNDGANSNITVTNFSDNASLMQFTVGNSLLISGFPQFAGGEVFPPVAAPLDNDIPAQEIVVARRDGKILAWRGDGQFIKAPGDSVTLAAPGKELRRFALAEILQLEAPLLAAPAFRGQYPYAINECYLLLQNGRVQAYRIRQPENAPEVVAELLWQAEVPAGASGYIAVEPEAGVIWAASGRSVCRFAYDGIKQMQVELASTIQKLAIHGDRVFILHENALSMVNANTGEFLLQSYPLITPGDIAIANVQAFDRYDYIAVSQEGRLLHFAQDGQLTSEARIATPLQAPGIALGDVDGDGSKDIVVLHAGGIVPLNAAGAVLENFPITFKTAKNGQIGTGQAPILLDIDNDGRQEIFALGASGDLYGVNSQGHSLPGFPVALASEGARSPGAADIDGDGDLELFVTSSDGFISAFKLPGARRNGAHAWRFANGFPSQNRLALLIDTGQPAAGDLLPGHLAYNYPNPTEGESTVIRYRLNGAAKVQIKIFDLAGDLVDEFPGPAVANMDNEIRWNLKNIQSGVYLARIEAIGGSEKATTVFKIAVVK